MFIIVWLIVWLIQGTPNVYFTQPHQWTSWMIALIVCAVADILTRK